jgi:hypothetical protein
LSVCQRFGKRRRASDCEKVGWIGALGKRYEQGIEPLAAEQPKGTFGCHAAGEVGVGCDNWVNSQGCKLRGLLVGQGGAERSDADVTPLAGQRDRDGIHRALHDYRDRPSGELVLKNSEQLRSLVE